MTEPAIIIDELPDHPGWRRWHLPDPTRFNQLFEPMMFRVAAGFQVAAFSATIRKPSA